MFKLIFFFFSSRRRHTRLQGDWSSDVCSSDLWLYAFSETGIAPRIVYEPRSPRQQLAYPKVSRDGRTVAFIAGLMSDFGSTGGDVFTVPIDGGAAMNLTPK